MSEIINVDITGSVVVEVEMPDFNTLEITTGTPGGSAGPTGPTGPPGEQGLSAYQVALSQGFVGTQPQWLESLRGEQGEDGQAGRDITLMGTLSDPDPLPSGPEVGDVWILGDPIPGAVLALGGSPSVGDGIVWRTNSTWDNIGQLRGDTGWGVRIKGTYDGTAAPLPTNPAVGDMWIIGDPVPSLAPASSEPGDAMVYQEDGNWDNIGPFKAFGIRIKGTLNGTGTALPSNPEIGDIWILGEQVPTAAPGTPEPGTAIMRTIAGTWQDIGPMRPFGIRIMGTRSQGSGAPSSPEIGDIWIMGDDLPGFAPSGSEPGDGVQYTITGDWDNIGQLRGPEGQGYKIKGTLSGTNENLPNDPDIGDIWIVGQPIPTDFPGTPDVGDAFVRRSSSWDNIGQLRGPEGPKGDDGADGSDGSDGEQGPQGDPGIAGVLVIEEGGSIPNDTPPQTLIVEY